ncbi:MAG TPA: HPr(Ser) kinase/phosphatase [Thermodesulfobacteriota bacterium]|nr:HPr(Ser) kinase/phosphatase [Thermodesulfobacteriota bacterium]
MLTVRELVAEAGETLGLELLAGEAGLERVITSPRIQKPGLALAGHLVHLHPGRVQILGATEISFLETLDPARQAEVAATLCRFAFPCLIVTKGLAPPQAVVAVAERHAVPLLRSPLLSSELIHRIGAYLEQRLAPSTTVHGVLVDVLGVGVLLTGKSGIGKSECALDLIQRGHRLVADDVVRITRREPDMLLGTGAEPIRHHMEIRGLGIINVKELFGITAVREVKAVDLVIELVEWDEEEMDRLGLDEATREILGVPLPLVRMPVRFGRNMTTIIEVAVRNHLLKSAGRHSARLFQERLEAELERAGQGRGGERWR